MIVCYNATTVDYCKSVTSNLLERSLYRNHLAYENAPWSFNSFDIRSTKYLVLLKGLIEISNLKLYPGLDQLLCFNHMLIGILSIFVVNAYVYLYKIWV